jgi:hypothetical protein
MFPLFPVLFPVCSQCQANEFIVFRAFPVSAVRAVSAISSIPFLHAQNTGNSENWTEMEGLARPAPWNRRGNHREQVSWSGNRSFKG